MTKTSQLYLSYPEAKNVAQEYKKTGKSIVLTQGSFDLIHIGHGRYLSKAKQQGDILFVGLDCDEKIQSRKGPDRPVVPEAERAEMLTYLSPVDHVVLKPAKAPKWQLIKTLKPDVLIATEATYTEAQLKELNQWCGQVVVLKSQATTSTSAKLRRLQIGFAQAFSEKLTEKVHAAIGQVLADLKR